MRELNIENAAVISGGKHIPDAGSLLIQAGFGAIAGALAGISGGPLGMLGGAVAGAALAAANCATLDAHAMSQQNMNP